MTQTDQRLLHKNKNQRISQFTNRTSGFIVEQKVNGPIRFLKKVDLFSFIPVPTDQPVSTKKSLIGTAIIIIIFLSYMIYDFVFFLIRNPGIPQVYYSKLDDQLYQLPRFSTSFMYGNYLNQTKLYEQYINFELTQEVKNPGEKYEQQVKINTYSFKNNSQTQKIKDLQWLNDKFLNFYYIQRTPSKKMYAKGLLYSTDNATYAKLLINLCDINNLTNNCKDLSEIQKLLAGGRLFLFIENKKMQTSVHSIDDENQNSFLLYDFFLVPGFYKRAKINFSVQKYIFYPDYFWRWTEQVYTRIKVNDIDEQFSDVNANFEINNTALQTLSISFILNPEIMNIRVTFVTLIDKISKWGALWGVLFAIFAFIFLSYNRNKYYRKNPEWQNFKKHLSQKEGQFIDT